MMIHRSGPPDLERVGFDEKSFGFELNEDVIATDKMAEAIRALPSTRASSSRF
jgi:hypothetical protein